MVRERAEAIINNWELIKVPDKSMEPGSLCLSSLLVLFALPSAVSSRDARYDMINNFKITPSTPQSP